MKKISLCSILFLIQILSAQSQFRPDSLAGLKLWLSADTGVVLNGSKVSFWKDRSMNNRDAYQTDTSAQPLFINSLCAVNNMPVLRFDGLNDHMLVDSPATVGSAFVLLNWNGSQPSFPDYNGIMTQQINTSRSIVFTATSSTTNLYTSPIDIVFGGATDYYVNGLQTTNLSPLSQYKIISGVTSSNPVTLNNFVIGRFLNNVTRSWNGDIAEIIIYSAVLTSAERQQVETYLTTKYLKSCTAAIEETGTGKGLSFYPNPLISSSFLHFNTQLKDAELIIYNILGKEIMRKRFSGNEVQIEKGDIQSGVYFVKVNADERQYIQKIIVE